VLHLLWQSFDWCRQQHLLPVWLALLLPLLLLLLLL
jgi:hypothetical protein